MKHNLYRILVCLLVLCLFCFLSGCSNRGSNTTMSQPMEVSDVAEDGSADKNIWDAYRIGIEQIIMDAASAEKMGLSYISDYYYDMALSGASSLQMTTCALLGDTSELTCPDWYSASAITRASAYPAFFQGLLCEFKEDYISAELYYQEAELYYDFPQNLYAFRFLKDASIKDLEKIKADCEAIITQINIIHSNVPYTDTQTMVDFMAGYHQVVGDEYAKEGALTEALQCYDMALRVNPFDINNYIACAALALETRDNRLFTYLGEGLALDERNAGLNILSAMAFIADGEAEIAMYYLDIARTDEYITVEQTETADNLAAQLGGAK